MDEQDYQEFKRNFFLTLRSNNFGEYIPESRVRQYFEQFKNEQFTSYVHAATHAMNSFSSTQGTITGNVGPLQSA